MTRMIVSMPEGFLKKIDQVAAMEHRSRSELVREALRKYLETSPAIKTKKRIEAARITDKARSKTIAILPVLAPSCMPLPLWL
ncbi:MAG: ribbon-helix-helix protein, CopG family, partial [Actinobacteria bacterium]|nr:ribbon-helix-helix protein, CopG family [Actinomycetota bacterium]